MSTLHINEQIVAAWLAEQVMRHQSVSKDAESRYLAVTLRASISNLSLAPRVAWYGYDGVTNSHEFPTLEAVLAELEGADAGATLRAEAQSLRERAEALEMRARIAATLPAVVPREVLPTATITQEVIP